MSPFNSLPDAALDGDLFYSTLKQAEVWLHNAHRAVLGTMEAELKHMRYENMRLRTILEEAGLGDKANAPAEVAFAVDEKPTASLDVMLENPEPPYLETPKEEVPPAQHKMDIRQVTASSPATNVANAANAQWIPVKQEGARSVSMSTVSTATPTTTPSTASPNDGFALKSKEEIPVSRPEVRFRPVPLEKTIEATLAQCGWQHLEAEILSESNEVSVVNIAGVKLRLRVEQGNEQRPRLLAWDEDTNAWQAFEGIIRKKRLQKVVRACPVAATREFTESESPKVVPTAQKSDAFHPSRQQPRGPLTLAQLEALPMGSPVKSRCPR